MFVGGGDWFFACDGGALHASFLPMAVYFFFFLLTLLFLLAETVDATHPLTPHRP